MNRCEFTPAAGGGTSDLAPDVGLALQVARGMTLMLVLIAPACAPAMAGPLPERPPGLQPQVQVTTASGKVTVTGSAKAREVKGPAGIEVRRNGEEVRVACPPDENLTLTVPEQARLEVRTRSGNIQVQGVKGEQQLKSISGDVQVRGAGKVRVKVVSGDVQLAGGTEVAVKTVSGKVQVQSVSGSLKIKTVSGNVRASQVSGSLKLSSVSGTAALEGVRGAEIHGTSGDVTVKGTLDKGQAARVQTHSGDIKVKLSAPAGLRYSLKSFSGKTCVCLPDCKEPTESQTPLTGTHGKGGASAELSSFSGDIELTVEK